MIRHEIIALHLATTFGKAEFYPSCSQIKVGGSETGAPNPDECVKFPGAYNDDDPGIYDPNVFDASAPYTFPGPPIAGFVNGGASPSSTASSSMASSSTALSSTASSSTVSSSTVSSSTVSTPTSTVGSAPPAYSSQASGQSCRITEPSPSTDVVQPRYFSRIMRLLAFGESRH